MITLCGSGSFVATITFMAFCFLCLAQLLSKHIEVLDEISPHLFHKNSESEVQRVIGKQRLHIDKAGVTKAHLPIGDNGTAVLDLLKQAMNDTEWQNLVCAGQHIMNMIDTPFHQDALRYCNAYIPTWVTRMTSPLEDPGLMKNNGWDDVNENPALRDLHIHRIASALEHYRLPTDPNEWVMKTTQHRRSWADTAGNQHMPTTAFFSYLINKRVHHPTMIWTAMFSPEYMIEHGHIRTVPPTIKFGSDLYYLLYYRYWTEDRAHNGADSAGDSAMPSPKTIIICGIHEQDIMDAFHKTKWRQPDTSPRVGAKPWPGDMFTRDDDPFYALMTTPVCKEVALFLTQHKLIFGAKSIKRIRMWSSNEHQNEFNMLFEIIESPPPGSFGIEADGLNPSSQDRRPIRSRIGKSNHRRWGTKSFVVDDQSIAVLRHLQAGKPYKSHYRRVQIAKRAAEVDGNEWNKWVCLGHAMYDLMSASDDAAAEQVAVQNPVLVKWRGRTKTPWPDPSILPSYGWNIFNDLNPNEDEIEIDGAVTGSGLGSDDEDWVAQRALHVTRWRDDGGGVRGNDPEAHDPTMAIYAGIYYKDYINPTIILTLTFSPWWYIEKKPLNTIEPPLKLMSDLVFLTYYEFWRKVMKWPDVAVTGGSSVPPPRYIFIRDISEEEAVDTIFPEVGRRGNFPGIQLDSDDEISLYFGNWPGVTFTPEDEDNDFFFALLATKQARAIAAFMITHKQEIGARRIKSITLWASEEDYAYCARFELEDCPSSQRQPSRAGFDSAISPNLKRRDSLVFDSGFV